ncbi:MAG TPA: hypothetical protein VGJ54_03045, partial [Streptosporangiaceae bacterium]
MHIDPLQRWRRGLAATRELTAATRDLLLYAGRPDPGLLAAFEAADRAVRAIADPPASLPAAKADRAVVSGNLDLFKQAAAQLGTAVAELYPAAIAQTKEEIEWWRELPVQVREVLPASEKSPVRAGAPRDADSAALAAALDGFDAQVRGLPVALPQLPATAAQMSAAVEAISSYRAQYSDLRQALVSVLELLIGQWDQRVAAARGLARAVRALLPYTGARRDDLAGAVARANEKLPKNIPGQPSDSQETSQAALLALERLTALEASARAVFTVAVQASRLPDQVAAAAELTRAAREMLPHTAEQQPRLTARLDQAVLHLQQTSPDWWSAIGRDPTAAEVDAAGRWLAGDGPVRVRRAADHLESVIADVAAAANQAVQRLQRLIDTANEQLPHAGARGPAVGLELFEAGGQPGGSHFTVARWPELRPGTAAEAAAAAAQIAKAAQEQARLQPAFRRLEAAIRRVFAGAIEGWQTRLATEIVLLGRLQGPVQRTGQRRHALQWDLERERQHIAAEAAEADTLQLGTADQMDAAALWLDRLATDHQADVPIRTSITLVIDEPMRVAEIAANLAALAQGLLPHVGKELADRLLAAGTGLRALLPLPAPAPVVSLPYSELDGALSQAMARLEDLGPAVTALLEAVTGVLEAGWQPRRHAVAGLLELAGQLLQTAGARLPEARQQALSAALAEAEQNVPDQPPQIPTAPLPAQLATVERALTGMITAKATVDDVFAEVNAAMHMQRTAARELAAAMRGLLRHTGAQRDALDAALSTAELNAGGLPELPLRSATAQTLAAAKLWLGALSALDNASKGVLDAAAAESDRLRPRVDAAQRLAGQVRALLPYTGGQKDQLTARLDTATADLRQRTLSWWTASGTSLTTVQEVEAAGRALDEHAPGLLENAASQVEHAVGAVLAGVVEWGQATRGVVAAAADAQDLLAHTGEHQAQLREALHDGGLVGDGGVGARDQWELVGSTLPDEQLVPAMEALLDEMIRVVGLEATVRRVTDAATDTARQRGDLLRLSSGLLQEILPRARVIRLYTAELGVPSPPDPPGPVVTLVEAINTARAAVTGVAGLEQSIAEALTWTSGDVADQVSAAEALFEGMAQPFPLTDAQRSDLNALANQAANLADTDADTDTDIANLGPIAATVRTGVRALIVLQAAVGRALYTGALRRAAQVAVERATGIQAREGHGLGARIQAVNAAVDRLPDRRPMTAAQARVFGERVRAVTTEVNALDAAIRALPTPSRVEDDAARPSSVTAEVRAPAPDMPPHTGDVGRAGTHAPTTDVAMDQRTADVLALGEAASELLPFAGGQRARLDAVLTDAMAGAAAVEVADHDVPRLAAIEAAILRVIARVTDPLPQRVADAPALAGSASTLLDLARRPAAGGPEFQTLAEDLRHADPAALREPSTSPPATAQAVREAVAILEGLAKLDTAASAVFDAAAAKLHRVWKAMTEARDRAAAARLLLTEGEILQWLVSPQARDRAAAARLRLLHDDPTRAEQSAALDAALGQLYEIEPGRPPASRADRVTVADLQAAQRALAAADDVGSATARLNQVADDALTAAPGRWHQWLTRADDVAADARSLFLSAAEQDANLGDALSDLDQKLRELGEAPQRNAATEDIVQAGQGLDSVVAATQRLDAVLRATAWWRARALLGPAHNFTREQVSRVMRLADSLVPAGTPTPADAEHLAWLAREIGLHHRDNRLKRSFGWAAGAPDLARLFALIDLAIQVFGGLPGLRALVAVRRLVDIARSAPVAAGGVRGRSVNLADLQAVFRPFVPGRGAAKDVAKQDLRTLALLVTQAKERPRRFAGGRRVTYADVSRLVASDQLVREVNGHLAAGPGATLTVARRQELILGLLNGPATADALTAVLKLLKDSNHDALRTIFASGEVPRRLVQAIPADHPQRGELDRFTLKEFGTQPAQARTPLPRKFTPVDIRPSLPRGVDDDLTSEQFDLAVQAVGGPPNDLVLDGLDLLASERTVAQEWVSRLHEAATLRDRIRRHFSPHYGEFLGEDEQPPVVLTLLSGPARWLALDLLDDMSDTTLTAMVADGLLAALNTAIPVGHDARDIVELFLNRRVHDGQVVEVHPGPPFSLDMISPRLSGIDMAKTPTAEQFKLIAAEFAGRSVRDIIISAKYPSQRAEHLRFVRWLGEIGVPARLVQQAQDFINGDWTAVRDTNDLAVLIHQLLTGPAKWQALDLLAALHGTPLIVQLFADVDVTRWLEDAIPVGHDLHPRLDPRWGRPPVRAAEPFSPGRLSSLLVDVRIDDELTGEQLMAVARAMARRTDAAITGEMQLHPFELARAQRWLRRAREAMVDRVLRHIAGAQGFELSTVEIRLLAEQILSDPITGRGPLAVLVLLEGTDHAQLAQVFHRSRLRELLGQAIPIGHALRHRVDGLFTTLYNDAGQLNAPVEPERLFSLDLVSPELAIHDIHDIFPEFLDYLPFVLQDIYELGSTAGVIDELLRLSPIQQAVAASWFGRVRSALVDRRTVPNAEESSPIRALDQMLNRLQAEATRRIPDAAALGDLTVTPTASEAPSLREALVPPVVPATHDGGRPEGFVDRLPDDSMDFTYRLREAFLAQIDVDETVFVTGKGQDEQAQPGNLYRLDHVQQIANLAGQWVDELFGRFTPPRSPLVAAEPGDEGNIYNLFAYHEWLSQAWGTEKYKVVASDYLADLLIKRPDSKPAGVAARHGAHVSFDWKSTEENRITRSVIKDLVRDPDLVRRIAEIERGWPARVESTNNRILVSLFRTPGKEFDWLWTTARVLIHETIHTRMHSEYDAFAKEFPGELDSREYHTLIEGVTDALAEVVWANVTARFAETDAAARTRNENWSRIVLGEYYVKTDPGQLPDLGSLRYDRYDAITEAQRLISRVGIVNLEAAFFLGLWKQIAGPVHPSMTVAPGGSTASTPTDGASTPTDGASTPTDGASTPSSVSTSDVDAERGPDIDFGDLRREAFSPAHQDHAEAAPPPAVLAPGWEWLDRGRGLAIPVDPALTGGTATARADWQPARQPARPGAGRGYAVHLPTGMIAVADGSSTGPGHVVVSISDGWVRNGSDLVHRSS